MSTHTTQDLKPRWHLADGERIAHDLLEYLAPYCERIAVAGSIRRRKATVGDVELVFVPRRAVGGDLFDGEPATDGAFADLIAGGVLEKREKCNGSLTWGQWNKLARHIPSGLPVDLFATTHEAWFNYLTCRTGGAQSNTEIAARAKAKGWRWNMTGAGFVRRTGPDRGRVHPVTSEADVFAFVGLPYLEPQRRK